MTRGKRPVSPVGPLPSSAAGFAVGVCDLSHGTPLRAAPAMAVAAARAGGVVTGLDFAPRMLERARRKLPSATWVEGDMLAFPFEAGSFEAVTVGFGVRNVSDLEGGLAELRRVLAAGGRVAVL